MWTSKLFNYSASHKNNNNKITTKAKAMTPQSMTVQCDSHIFTLLRRIVLRSRGAFGPRESSAIKYLPLTKIWPDRFIVSFKKHCNNIHLTKDSVECNGTYFIQVLVRLRKIHKRTKQNSITTKKTAKLMVVPGGEDSTIFSTLQLHSRNAIISFEAPKFSLPRRSR